MVDNPASFARGCLVALVACISACHSGADPRFPLRPPVASDNDMAPVSVGCRRAPTEKDPTHVTCAPEPYVSPLYWDGADNLVFRPLSDAMKVSTSAESANVNSLDEVPDSSWFTNRPQPLALSELRRGGCSPAQILDPNRAADDSWVIDKGKDEGSSPGFRMKVPGQGKYLVKAEDATRREGQTAASVVGMAIFHAIGYFTPCEQIIYVRPSVFKLTPGLRSRANFSDWVDFDRAALERVFARSTKRDGLIRLSASSWISGYAIGPARYVGMRADDPNDVVLHEDRREIRAMRLADAWFDRWDAREENSLDTWMTDAGKGAAPDASPGHVVHYQLDTSESIGGEQSWEPVSRRLGYSYMIDWGDMARDFATLGIRRRSYDLIARVPGRERFGFMDVAHFDPEAWKAEYPNPAFTRMSERDGAWMARILARFTPAHVRAFAELGQFSDAGDTDYLARVLEGRLERILQRYLLRVSPITDIHLDERGEVCGVDLAAARALRPETSFRYTASSSRGAGLVVAPRRRGELCVAIPHAPIRSGAPDADPARRVALTISDGVAAGPLIVDLYDLGSARGFALAGVARPH